MHYKTIKFKIKIPMKKKKKKKKKKKNLRRALREKLDIATLRAKRAEKFGIFLTFTPPIRKMDRCRCLPPLTRYARYATVYQCTQTRK